MAQLGHETYSNALFTVEHQKMSHTSFQPKDTCGSKIRFVNRRHKKDVTISPRLADAIAGLIFGSQFSSRFPADTSLRDFACIHIVSRGENDIGYFFGCSGTEKDIVYVVQASDGQRGYGPSDFDQRTIRAFFGDELSRVFVLAGTLKLEHFQTAFDAAGIGAVIVVVTSPDRAGEWLQRAWRCETKVIFDNTSHHPETAQVRSGG